jgi:nucleoside phosphorylase/tetratricopeptide (TPR) repeat protein
VLTGDPHLDVIVLTALTLEYKAALKVDAGASAGTQWSQSTYNGLPIAFREFQGQGGRPLRVAVAQPGGMGAIDALVVLVPLVELYKPRVVAMSGVCAGRPNKTSLGDVVAAERLYFHDTGKQLPKAIQQDIETYSLRKDWKVALEHFDFAARFRGEPWWIARPLPHSWQENWVLAKLLQGVADPSQDPESERACPQWDQVITTLWQSRDVKSGTRTLTAKGKKRIKAVLIRHRNQLPDPSPSGMSMPFKVHVAPMGSGNKVIEDPAIWSFVSEHMRTTLALEMEAAALGALVRARVQSRDGLDALVMKGIMDFADEGRDDHFKDYAAHASAECLLAFLRENLTPGPGPGGLYVVGRAPTSTNGTFVDGPTEYTDRFPAPTFSLSELHAGRDVNLIFGSRIAEALPSVEPHQLPPAPPDFSGREENLSHMERRWRDGCRTFGIFGLSGIGKTALALRFASLLLESYPDAQIFLDLSQREGRDASPQDAIKDALRAFTPTQVLPDDFHGLRAMYLSFLNGRRALIIADNASSRDQILAILPGASCCLVVTAQSNFVVPGLEPILLPSLTTSEATLLLEKLGIPVGPSSKELASLCGGHPLALRAVGTLLRERPSLSVEDIISKLSVETERLKLEGSRTEGLSISIEAAFLATFAHLSPAQGSNMLDLSVFPASFEPDAAAAVWETSRETAVDMLGDLTQRNLVDLESLQSTKRFKLHDLIRVFVKSRIEPIRFRKGRTNHSFHYLKVLQRLANEFSTGNRKQVDVLREFDTEWLNIEHGHTWLAQNLDGGESIGRIFCAYTGNSADVLGIRLHPKLHMLWLHLAVQVAWSLGDPQELFAQLGNMGNVFFRSGKFDDAELCFSQGLSIARSTSARRDELLTVANLSNVKLARGHWENARKGYEEVLEDEGCHLSPTERATMTGMLAATFTASGDHEIAINLYIQSLEQLSTLGARVAEARFLSGLGDAYLQGSVHNPEYVQLSHKSFLQGLAYARETRDGLSMAKNLAGMGGALAASGKLDEAIEHLNEGARISSSIGQLETAWYAVWTIGRVLERQGDLGEAVRHMQGFVDYLKEIGHSSHTERAIIVEELRRRMSESAMRDNVGIAPPRP